TTCTTYRGPKQFALALINSAFASISLARIDRFEWSVQEVHMSWEVDGRVERPCACGKGTWVEISESDDWGGSRSHAEINCAECRKNCWIDEVHDTRKGMATVSYRLMSRSSQ